MMKTTIDQIFKKFIIFVYWILFLYFLLSTSKNYTKISSLLCYYQYYLMNFVWIYKNINCSSFQIAILFFK
jgi:hypothetical protein